MNKTTELSLFIVDTNVIFADTRYMDKGTTKRLTSYQKDALEMVRKAGRIEATKAWAVHPAYNRSLSALERKGFVKMILDSPKGYTEGFYVLAG